LFGNHLTDRIRNSQNNYLKQFESLITQLFTSLAEKRSSTPYDFGLFGHLTSNALNLKAPQILDSARIFLISKLEEFISTQIQSGFLVDGKTTLPNVTLYVDSWKTIVKIHDWLKKALKAMPFEMRPEVLAVGLFKENVIEREDVKKCLITALLEEIEKSKLDKAADDKEKKTDSKNEPIPNVIIRSLVVMGYKIDDFGDETLKASAGDLFATISEEERKKAEPVTQSREHAAYNYKPSGPFNDYPYKETFVGLKNQGALCYLNSLIQALYFVPVVRRTIFQWKYNKAVHGAEEYCILLQLQNLFARLRLSEMKAVETVNLTKSFGWERQDSFVQQDTNEFMRVLFENLINEKIPIEEIFEGK